MTPRNALLPALLLAAGCAGAGGIQEEARVPYKAVVAFDWPADGPAAAGKGSAGAPPRMSLSRGEVEEEILEALREYRVFSDFRPAARAEIYEAATAERADLIVLVRIGELVRWEETAVKAVPGLVAVDALLWVGTGIGSWWVPDLEYSTRSDVDVRWKRPEDAGGAAPVAAAAAEPAAEPDAGRDALREFKLRESLMSGDYRLSLWDRAKPWRQPLAYLTSIVVPPVLVPLRDRAEVDRSLALRALEDIKRELARKLKGGALRSGGSPFLFRLESPANGAEVAQESVKLEYRYDVEPGFEEHEPTGLASLEVEVKREGDAEYRKWREFGGAEVRAINEKIARDEAIEETVGQLGSGLNLIRFVARAEQDGQCITNTVALFRR